MQNNSVLELVDTLKKFPLLTENELMEKTYGYRRGRSLGSNKKYAQMLRRGVEKGLISRVELKSQASKCKFWYFV